QAAAFDQLHEMAGLDLVRLRNGGVADRGRNRPPGLVEVPAHPLLAAGRGEQLPVALDRPFDRPAQFAETGVEGDAVAVALGVDQHPVAIEDHGLQHGGQALPAAWAARPSLPKMRIMSRTSAFIASYWAWMNGSGSDSPGFRSRQPRKPSMKRCLCMVEMFTLAHPAAMQRWNCSSLSPVPPCRAMGMSMASVMRSSSA